MKTRKNIYKDQRYQVDIKTPDSAGNLATPSAGTITGIVMRLSASRYGPAIHVDLDNLAATETPGTPSRFYVDVDAALQVTHLLPLGDGASYFAIWKKAGDMDNESVEFAVAVGTVVA